MRCANLPLAWDLLERLAAGDPRACWWRESRQRIMVAPVDLSFVVVLQDRPMCFYLATAHPVGESGRRKLMKRAAEPGHVRRRFHVEPRHPTWRRGRVESLMPVSDRLKRPRARLAAL